MFLSDFNPDTACLTVRLCGEIDHHSAVSVRSEIDAMLYHDHPDTLIFDLSEVDFMDSSGLGLIMGRYALISELGGKMLLRAPSERTRKILELAGIERLIKIENKKKKVN